MANRLDQLGNKSESPLTPTEIAAYKTWAATPFGAFFVAGVTDATNLATTLNAQHTQANPIPQGVVPVATIAHSDVQLLITNIVGTLLSQTPPPATLAYWQWFQDEVDKYAEKTYTAAEAAPWAAKAVSEGLMTQDQVTALTTAPDTNYANTWVSGPLAPMIFGSWLVLEVSDATLLLAS